MVAAGAAHYATLCVGCHLAPGITKSTLRAGLYPHAPNLAQEDRVDARKAFWTVKHGVKMSAMPAWGKSLDDATIWEIVAFVRQCRRCRRRHTSSSRRTASNDPGCAGPARTC
jgi:mono/diheme cytochrome c family protein